MSMQVEYKFDFISEALPKDGFSVVSFEGEEGLSQCYRFEIMLALEEPGNMHAVMDHPATLVIKAGGVEERRYQGIVTSVEFDRHGFIRDSHQDVLFWRVVLEPKLKLLDMILHNQVFLDRPVEGMLRDLLEEAGLFSTDYEFRVSEREFDPPRELICQYRQSSLGFFNFWTERMGMYYFFEQPLHEAESTGKNEKLIVTNNKLAHARASGQGETLYFEPPTGLDASRGSRVLKSFTYVHQRLPGKVLVRDYDYNQPSLDLSAEAVVETGGPGRVYLYSDHVSFDNEKAGQHLARIRAEELNCRTRVFKGRSHSTRVRSGYTFEVEEHPDPDLNREYLATRVTHRGRQAGYLIAGLEGAAGKPEGAPFYENEFKAISSNVQYRSERRTPASRILGTMTAFIDAAGTGRFAELDKEGRYKVILPFDLSGRKGLKASAWLRMAQPFTGADQGMHFPLHKGTEVLLSFIDGDPSRPVIVGSVPNAVNRSLVGADNANMSGLKTPTGSSVVFGDHQDGASVLMNASVGNLKGDQGQGAPQGPSNAVDEDAFISLKKDHSWAETLTSANSVNSVAGLASSEVVGLAKNLHSLGSDGTLVGAPIFKAISALVNNVVKKLPSLAVGGAKDLASVGKLAQDQRLDEEKKQKEKELEAHYDKKRQDLDKAYHPAQTSGASSAESVEDRVARMEKEKEYEKKKKAIDDEESDKKKEWGLYYDREKYDSDQTATYFKTALSFLSAILMPVWELYFDLVLKKSIAKGLKRDLSDKIARPAVKIPDEHKDMYGGDFAYSVITDGSCVSQSLQSKWKGPKAMADPPKGMMWYEGVGSQMFYAEANHMVQAKESSSVEAKDVRHFCTRAAYQAWEDVRTIGKHIDGVASNSIQLQTTSRSDVEGQYNQWPKPKINRKGINLIADAGHNIVIKQDDGEEPLGSDDDGHVDIESPKYVNIQSGRAAIFLGTSGISGDGIEIFYDTTAINLGDKGIEITIKNNKRITVDEKGVKIQTSPGAPILTVEGKKVTINGDLTITGKFTQPNQTNS